MDPITTGALAIVGTEALRRTVGPSLDLIGKGLAGRISAAWPKKNLHGADGVVTAAAKQLNDAGLPPQLVPGRILWPLLESAVLEEEPDLSLRWASLLANAASPTAAENEILPGYIEVLRQLTPKHALILDWLYKENREVNADVIRQAFELSIDRYALFMADFQRLMLLRPTGTQFQDAWIHERYRMVKLTTFGFYFVRSCLPPTQEPDIRRPFDVPDA